MVKPPKRVDTHRERMEEFYRDQAEGYDEFRQRLLHGREMLFDLLKFPDGAVWVDMGAGTGENLNRVGDRAARLKAMHWIDLSPSLLAVARKRARSTPWADRIHLHEADATDVPLPDGVADVVTFSYSLTMIPDWFAAIAVAERLLKPGGQIGVVDFFVSRKHPPADEMRHSSPTRLFWPAWFGWDNVHPSPDHLPMLRRLFATETLNQSRGKVPYLPFLRAPYYVFVGTKRHSNRRPSSNMTIAHEAENEH